MELKTIKYDYNIIKENKADLKKFKQDISDNNVIYLFFEGNKCLYIGQTENSLKERCYKNTPKHSEKEWFKKANIIYIIKLDECIDNIARHSLEATFILSYRPENNKS